MTVQEGMQHCGSGSSHACTLGAAANAMDLGGHTLPLLQLRGRSELRPLPGSAPCQLRSLKWGWLQ